MNPSLGGRAAAALLMLAVSHAASLAQAPPRPAPAASAQAERAACLFKPEGTDREACLREAAAARAEAQRGTLGNATSAEQRQQNAQDRCRPLPATEREDCLRRLRGEGTTSGSVEGGGIYRELVTRSTDPPAASDAASAPGSSASASISTR